MTFAEFRVYERGIFAVIFIVLSFLSGNILTAFFTFMAFVAGIGFVLRAYEAVYGTKLVDDANATLAEKPKRS